jgi:hypothetical protein
MNDAEILSFISSCNEKGMSKSQAAIAVARQMSLCGMTGTAMAEAVTRLKAQINSSWPPQP